MGIFQANLWLLSTLGKIIGLRDWVAIKIYMRVPDSGHLGGGSRYEKYLRDLRS